MRWGPPEVFPVAVFTAQTGQTAPSYMWLAMLITLCVTLLAALGIALHNTPGDQRGPVIRALAELFRAFAELFRRRSR